MISGNYIDLEGIRSLTAVIGTHQQLQDLLAMAHHSYQICLKIDEEWDVLTLASKLNERETWKMTLKAGKKEEKRAEHWMFGELQIFTCVIFIYCHSKNITLAELADEDFLYLRSIFTHKSLEFIKYEVSRILHSKTPRKEWHEKEMAIVKSIIGEDSIHIDWRMVSFELFKESKGKYTRCQKECREKWKNYLNPHIKKGHWTTEEDEKLYQLIEKYGTKWSLIAKHFKDERTEHMVKNRYNSLNRPSKKKKGKQIKKQKVDRVNEECISQISAIMEESEKEKESEQQPQSIQQKEQLAQLQDSLLPLPQPENFSISNVKDIQSSFHYLQGTNYFQKKILSNSHSIYDNFLKRTNDEDEEEDNDNHFKICLEPSSLWETIKQPHNGFDSIFSMQPEAKRSTMDEIVSALGCTHYERIFNSWEEEEEASHFEWIE